MCVYIYIKIYIKKKKWEHMNYILNVQTHTPSKSDCFSLYIFLSKKARH